MDEVDSVLVDNIKSFASGGFGGICAVVTGHPFDLVKVRLQTNLYNNAIECVKQTVKNDGLLGLYRGVLPPLLGVTPMFAVSFWGYDMGKNLVASLKKKDVKDFTIGEISAAGFLSAIPTTAVAAPFERIKVLLQVQESGTKSSMGQIVKQLYKEGGISSIYKGSLATMARDGPGSALYFATYEYVKQKLSKEGEMSLLAISTAGGLAGVAMWTAVFPIDTIKSMQQTSKENLSLVQTTRKIYLTGGTKAFFPGIGPALARSFPANAATFVGVELARNFLNSF